MRPRLGSGPCRTDRVKRIVEIRDEQRRWNQWVEFFDGIGSAWSAGEAFHHLIMGGDDVYGGPDRLESAEFWEFLGIPEEQQCDSRFVLGFADAAAESYDRVEG